MTTDLGFPDTSLVVRACCERITLGGGPVSSRLEWGDMASGDLIQIGGLAVNAGLLLGLIVQVRTATKARRTDIHRARQQATMEAWRTLTAAVAKGSYAILCDFAQLRAAGSCKRNDTPTISPHNLWWIAQ